MGYPNPPNSPYGGYGDQNQYPGGYAPPPGGEPGYGSGPQPSQGGWPAPPPSGPQQPYPQQGYPGQYQQQPGQYQQHPGQYQQYPGQYQQQPGQYPVQYQQHPGQYQQQPGGMPSSDERTMALLSHLGGLLFSLLIPLVLYLVKKDESQYIKHQAAQAFNFSATVLIGYIVSGVLSIVLIGLVLFPIVGIVHLVFAILAAVAANKGEWYKYPIAIPMLS